MCEALECRCLASHSPVVQADLLAVRSARAMLLADHALLTALVNADVAAIPAAISNIGASIHQKESALAARVASDLNRIAFDEHQGPATFAADLKLIRRETVLLRVDQGRGNTTAANADASALAAADKQLATDQASAASLLAADKAALQNLKASEGSQIRAAKLAAINAVRAAKVKLITDRQQRIVTLNQDTQRLAAAMAKLRSDAAAGA